MRTHQKTHYPEAHIQDDDGQDDESNAESDSSTDNSLSQTNEPMSTDNHRQEQENSQINTSNHLQHPPSVTHDEHQASLQQNHLDQSQLGLHPVPNPLI